MKKLLYVLPVALTALAAGCVRTPPSVPSLHSTQPKDRLGAINHLTQQFGARKDEATATENPGVQP